MLVKLGFRQLCDPSLSSFCPFGSMAIKGIVK